MTRSYPAAEDSPPWRGPRVQWAVVLVCAVAMVAALALRLGSGSAATAQAYYLDLNTGELLVASGRHGTTMARPTGPMPAVMAYLFACGACDQDARFGYVETIWPDTHGPPQAMTAFYNGENGQNLQWVLQDAAEGEAVRLRVFEYCPDPDLLRECHP